MRILVIQTAFIGDAILATALLEKLHRHYPQARLDLLVRHGNQALFEQHPFVHTVLVWDKRRHKYANLWKVLGLIRTHRYDYVINCQRFAASGLLTALSGAPHRIGYDKNPFAWTYTQRLPHLIGPSETSVFGYGHVHEIERNHSLIATLTDPYPARPRLYPTPQQAQKISQYQQNGPYVCMSPASVWFTKRWPPHKWAALIRLLPPDVHLYMLGAPNDYDLCASILQNTQHPNAKNLAGALSLLESAALMAGATMNYVNDSAPLHLASALNAPVTAIFCSTVVDFGFTPVSDHSRVVQTTVDLACRPCGLHGKSACPQGHFACGEGIAAETVQ
jgi:heptosyltransferase II